MSSPLLPYFNAYLAIGTSNNVEQVNGRLVTISSQLIVFKAFLKRESDAGSGGGAIARTVQTTNPLPGIDGQGTRYKGYLLAYGYLTGSGQWDGSLPSTWTNITSTFNSQNALAIALSTGREGRVKIGNMPIQHFTLESASGDYGGGGAIDKLIYEQVGGIPTSMMVGQVGG
jgi:hypothetical protein